jgi:cation diffusion facilitator family transporter
MTPQRRTALVSVLAACVLIAVKVVAGIAAHSLGLLSEAAHSGTDLVAALLTFFAIGVAARPADRGHAYGHGKAEHLAALAEGVILVIASLLIVWRSVLHLLGSTPTKVEAAWYTFGVLAFVIAVDLSRTIVSWRAARRYRSSALGANAIHFASDLAGSFAVLVGLLGVRAGWKPADSAAALFVAALVLTAAFRLMRRNVDVLMDRAAPEADDAAREAIARVEPPVELRRLRMRQAAGRHFADVVIGVPPALAKATPWPTQSRARFSARCRRATSSSMSSPRATSLRCGSAPSLLPRPCRPCGRSTTWPSLMSAAAPRCRST